MEYFLQNIARHLHEEYGDELNQHCLVFPNRRAGLYFNKYLASLITTPVWSPVIYTINDLFASSSSLQKASPETLLFELYKVYRRVKKSPEKFDDFYFWGDMLLNDFDDLDKYLVDARLLFQNVLDIRNIDRQFGELTEEQVEVIKKFWVNFNPEKPSKQKDNFTDVWSVLHTLYLEFRESLRSKGLAYEGMIFREIAEAENKDYYSISDWKLVHFTGFNALNECEKVVMKGFRKAGKARFYWDYDSSYISDARLNSAGFFMRSNLRMFGNDMAGDWSYDTLLTSGFSGAGRRVIETSSDVAQVKLVPRLIRQLPDLTGDSAHHTAIVLADENLLIPLLTSLPEDVGDINITMGYPLKHTLVYTFICHLMDLQKNASQTDGQIWFDHKDVLNILKHPLAEVLTGNSCREMIKEITEKNLLRVPALLFSASNNLASLFSVPDSTGKLSKYFRDILTDIGSVAFQENQNTGNPDVDADIRNEFIYRAVLAINRLESIVSREEVVFSTITYMKILDKILKMQSVPFSGEPLSGIQIMGILETRALDFRNLIILSVNEGVLPAVSTGSSFIPFTLREAFGIPSVNHQESVYAYHFYRLLQRAENVTFLYNSNSDGLRTGEMSRFITQMKYDERLKPEFLNLSYEIRSLGSVSETIERTEEHYLKLKARFFGTDKKRLLSPSAINTWLACRMKFYYRYINDLQEPEVISGDIDQAMLGKILHLIMFTLYSGFKGKTLTASDFDQLIRDDAMIEQVVRQSIDSEFSGGQDRRVEGTELIIREVLKAFVIRIIRTDKSLAPLTIVDLESVYTFPVKINTDGQEIVLNVGGVADRIDRIGGTTRIVDYKTGIVAEKIGSIEELFTNDRKKDMDAWLQTLLYCEAFLFKTPDSVIMPSVYRIKNLSLAENDRLKIKTDSRNDFTLEDYKVVRENFLNHLKKTIDDIFSKDSQFTMTEDRRGKCSWCPYRGLCTR